jgi:hypothetical protein
MSVTVTDVPSSEASHTSWFLQAGSDKVSAVQSDDSGTTTIATNINAGAIESYFMPKLPGEAHSPAISGVTGISIMSGAGTGTFQTFYNGVSTTVFTNPPSGQWQHNLETAFAGADLVIATLNAAEYGVNANTSLGSFQYCTYVYRRVTYEVDAGGFSLLLTELVGPLLGACLLPRMMRGIARELELRPKRMVGGGLRRFALIPAAYDRAFQELVAHKHPKHFLMGVA